MTYKKKETWTITLDKFLWINWIAVDIKSNIYASTSSSIHILKPNTSSKKLIHVSSIEGNANTKGIAWDGSNSLYVCNSNFIHKLDLDNLQLSHFAGMMNDHRKIDGPLEQALFHCPHGITIDKHGDIYVTEKYNIRKIDMKNRTVSLVAGSLDSFASYGFANGLCKNARFVEPFSVVVGDDGTIYITDQLHHCVRQIKDGVVSTLAGTTLPGSEDGPFDTCSFKQPTHIVLDGDGNLLVLDAEYGTVRKLDLKKREVTPVQEFRFHQGIAMATDSYKNVYLVTQSNQLIKLFRNTWQMERWIWLGHLKEDSKDCFLAILPKEIIMEITHYLKHS